MGTKQLLGQEDVLFGQGAVEQWRFGTRWPVTKINSGSIPYQGEPGDTNYKTVKTVLEELLISGGESIVEW